jgi:hypothetical protein
MAFKRFSVPKSDAASDLGTTVVIMVSNICDIREERSGGQKARWDPEAGGGEDQELGKDAALS